ncbi:MAG: hypothetical protein ACYCY1_12565 [Sulfuriferula sp.]
MKLQINTSGAWRDVIRYDEPNDGIVRVIASHLAELSAPKPAKMRLLCESGEVTAYFELGQGWHKPEHPTCD